MDKVSYKNFVAQLLDHLDQICDDHLDSFDEHKGFVYLIASLFESLEPDKFKYTDGSYDGNIDFFINDSPIFSIYQCKCPALTEIDDFSIKKYDENTLSEIIDAINYLLDKKNEKRVNDDIKILKTDFHREKELDNENDLKAPQLVATLAIMGELTANAKKSFESYQSNLSEKGVTLKLIDWDVINDRINITEEFPEFSIKLKIDGEGDILRKRDFCYLIGYGYDFYTNFRKHGWILFDLNVRYHLTNSPINKKIVNTLMHANARKNFHHLNNGLLIICDSYSIRNDLTCITLKNPMQEYQYFAKSLLSIIRNLFPKTL